MKVVVCSHPECDYLGEGISVGLYENGHDIYELPYVRHIHNEPDSDYFLADGNLGYTGVSGFLANNPLPPNKKSEEEVLEAAKDADLIIAHSTRRYALEALDKIIARLGKNPGNILLVCGEDHQNIPIELINKYQPLIFAKRELNSAYSLAAYAGHFGIPIVPCPFGAFIRGLPEVDDTQKDWDLFATFGQTNEIRNTILFRLMNMIRAGALDRLSCWIGTNDNAKIYLENTDIMRPMMPWAEYISLQARSKIGLSVPGWGGDTLRHWELMSFATLCLYVHPNIHIPYPFRNREHCIYLGSNFSNLEDEITYYLQNTEESVEIATAGKKHCRTYHTASTRAQYLVDIAIKRLSGESIRWEEYDL